MRAHPVIFEDLLEGSKHYKVPPFQRRYRWASDQWTSYWRTIQAQCTQIDGDDDTRTFLGSIVTKKTREFSNGATNWLLIDGQQRITTTLIILAALRDIAASSGDQRQAELIDLQLLKNPYLDDAPYRLEPTKPDRPALYAIYEGQASTDNIGRAYDWFHIAISNLLEDTGVSITTIRQAILTRLELISIEASPRDVSGDIFNTLNSKGLSLAPSDLIRNELLLPLSYAEQEDYYDHIWEPLDTQLTSSNGRNPAKGISTGRLDSFLLTRELAVNDATGRLSSSDLFTKFEQRLKRTVETLPSGLPYLDRRAEIARTELQRIAQDAPIYLSIIDNDTFERNPLDLDSAIHDALGELRRWNSTQAIPAIFAVLRAGIQNSFSSTDTADALHSILSFMVRRSLADSDEQSQLNFLFDPFTYHSFRLFSENQRNLLSASPHCAPVPISARSPLAIRRNTA